MSIIFKPPISKLPIIVFLLTLSGIPSHMNLKHLLSISFLYLSGTTHALATKVNIGMTNALIIIIFPRIVKFRFLQEKNKVLILSILFSQFYISHSSLLLPKYTPNVLIGFSDHLMPSILSLLCLSFPTQIPPVLFLFINNPEKDPKVSISLNAK